MIDTVKNAGPLPYSGYEEVFEKEITFIFNYTPVIFIEAE